MKIAYLSCTQTLPGAPDRRSDAFEHDYMMSALREPFLEKGMQIVEIAWNDPDADWDSYGAAMIGTTWDYWDHQDAFLSTLEKIETVTPLFNPSDMVRWNSDKSYLRDLENKGARLIPTLWLDEVTPLKAKAAFATLGSDDLVFKRQVGAGAEGQYRLKPGDPIPDMPHPMMVQPFLSMIQTEGEHSFIFIDGDFSHALIKRAARGDYRVQSTYGGSEEIIVPSADDLAAAKAVLDTLSLPPLDAQSVVPLYARVDMLRGDDGGLLLMEMELIEPYLYPVQGPQLGQRLAAALVRRLAPV